ncbi:MAG: hypothetical protein ACRD4S_02395 [Candidatus Acidiferrales bacterium]
MSFMVYFGEMAGHDHTELDRHRAGLCADCMHSRQIQSLRGSVFLLCGLSAANPEFAKYPRLPVVVCSGHKPMASP